MIYKVTGHIRGALLLTIIVMTCLAINILQLSTIALGLFLPSQSYYVQSFLLGLQIRFMQLVFEKAQGGTITYSGDKLKSGDSALVISNHQSWSDFYLVDGLASQLGMEPYIRYFIKDVIKYLPFFGWALYFSDQLFVKRNWLSDQTLIDRVFARILKYKLPIWIVTYPEGTRYTETKLEQSKEFCRSRDQPILNNVLYPRTKGPVAAVKKLRQSHVRYLYDLTMAYRRVDIPNGFRSNPNPLHIHFSHGVSNYQFHVHIDKFLIDDLPTDDVELSDWFVKRFQIKDKVLEQLQGKGWTEALDCHKSGGACECLE